MSTVRDIFVSAAAVLQPGRTGIKSKISEIEACLRENYAHYEILVIDTPECAGIEKEMEELLKVCPKIRYLRIFNAVSEKILYAAGIENAIGDVIVVGNLDFLNSENITNAVECCCAGNDVVSGISDIRKPLFYTFGSFLFRRFFGKMISYHLPENDTYFRCISRRVANAAMAAGRFHMFVFLRLSNAGGKNAEIRLRVPEEKYRKCSMSGGFSKAISMLVFNTVVPLRIINGIALSASLLALLFAAYTVVVKLIKAHIVEGWPTLMLMLSGMFFLLFAILALIGEYLVRIILDRADAQPYSVVFEKHSSVMLDLSTLNIRKDSVSEKINLTQTGRDR